MIGLSIASDQVRDCCVLAEPLIEQSEAIPMQKILSWKFRYLTGHLQLGFKSVVFQVFSLSLKWSHRIGLLGGHVTNLLKHFLHQDLPWHEAQWVNQVLGSGSGSRLTMCPHCWGQVQQGANGYHWQWTRWLQFPWFQNRIWLRRIRIQKCIRKKLCGGQTMETKISMKVFGYWTALLKEKAACNME